MSGKLTRQGSAFGKVSQKVTAQKTRQSDANLNAGPASMRQSMSPRYCQESLEEDQIEKAHVLSCEEIIR